MAAFLVDESCPRAVVEALRDAGHNVRYAADTDRRAEDVELVAIAHREKCLIVSEDFDFGELLVRRRLSAPGALILHMPRSSPQQRAARIVAVLKMELALENMLTIVTARQVRQRPLPTD